MNINGKIYQFLYVVVSKNNRFAVKTMKYQTWIHDKLDLCPMIENFDDISTKITSLCSILVEFLVVSGRLAEKVI